MAIVKCNAKNKEGDVSSDSISPPMRLIKTDGMHSNEEIYLNSFLTITFFPIPLDTPKTIKIITVVSILSFVFFVFLRAYLSRKRRKRRQIFSSETVLQPDIYEEFLKGDPDGINMDMTLDDQVGLLPYDGNYEFPRERLQIGKQIGAGAFGMVTKAIACGILPDEKETTVAVKTAKQAMDSQVCYHELGRYFHIDLII